MALSNKALQTLSKAITEEVVEEIFSSDAYVEFMMRIIPDVIQEKMGALDDELLGELAFMVFDNINHYAHILTSIVGKNILVHIRCVTHIKYNPFHKPVDHISRTY